MTKLSETKEEILSSLLKFLVVLGGVAYVPSLAACLQDKLYGLALINTLSYAVIAVVVFRKGTPYTTRLWVTVACTLFIGGAVLFMTGTDGAGHLWLICGVVISALFGNLGIIILTIVLSELIMVCYAIMISIGIIQSSITFLSLAAIASNLLVISITLALIIHKLLQALDTELELKEELLRLLHHRVKNNLQTVESLIAMEHSAESNGTTSRLSRRVSAVSAANHLLLLDHGRPSIQLTELIRSFLRPGIDQCEGDNDQLIQPEKVSEMAIFMSDFFTLLQTTGPLSVLLQENTIEPSAPKGADSTGCQMTVKLESPRIRKHELQEQLSALQVFAEDVRMEFIDNGCIVSILQI